jgi:hypothetical protein
MTQFIRETHFKELVWVNPKTDIMRREECLCFNCKNASCNISNELFSICRDDNLALMVTRCKNFVQGTKRQQGIIR